MNIFGKSTSERNDDADKLKKCIEKFSNAIKEISFNDEENFDKITYNKFSYEYNEAFKEYIKGNKSKAWFSHTNDVLKKIAKEIKKYNDQPILEQTYLEYYDCYCYDTNKKKKDAAIDSEDARKAYIDMLKELKIKLKEIVKQRKNLDIKTSGNKLDEYDDDDNKDIEKQKDLFKKFKKFDEKLDALELDGSCKQISQIFREVFDENIKGKGKWFSHTNDVFKAIDKKLKSFDGKSIYTNHKEYVECFKYDQNDRKKSSKKATINNIELFNSYQKLYERIFTKLKEFNKGICSSHEKLEGAFDRYKKYLENRKSNIVEIKDIIKCMELAFNKDEVTNGKEMYDLFCYCSHPYYLYSSRVEASKYFKGAQEKFDDKNYSKKFKKVFYNVKDYTEKFIRNRVKSVEKKLSKELKSIRLTSCDFSNKMIEEYLEKFYSKYIKEILCSVIETINFTCDGDFTICKKDNFGGKWEQNKYLKGDEQVYPKLKTINIKGGKLTEIGEKNFECPSNLKEINFDNVEISEKVDLENMKTKFGSAKVTINDAGINTASIDDCIKDEKNCKSILDGINAFDGDFNLSHWVIEYMNRYPNARKIILVNNLNVFEKLQFKPKDGKVTLGKEAFNIDKFKDIKFTDLTEIEFNGNLIGIDEDAFSGKPAKLEKIILDQIDNSIENFGTKVSEIARKAGVAIEISNQDEI